MNHPPDDATLAYLAGFFDGEGHVAADFRQHLVCSVTNNRIDILKCYQGRWGGQIYQQKPKKYARTVSYEWKLSSRKAERLLRDILPYLTIKHSQAALGIQLSCRPSLRHYGSGRAGLGRFPERDRIRQDERELRRWIAYKLRELKSIGKTYVPWEKGESHEPTL